MPIYEYECEDGHRTEIFERHPVAREICPLEGCAFPARRVISRPSRPRIRGGTPKFHRGA